jgi:RNA polymerase sigma-70 factor (ECF subfamily)
MIEQVPSLAATFLAHAKVRFVSPVDTTALEHLLARTWESCRAQWPTVALPADLFVTHLAERLPPASPDSPIEPLLASLSVAELYLACACARGLPSAIELFDRNYLAKLPALLRNPKQPEAMIEDVCQLARMKLLVSTPESAAKIGEYSGKGALMSWVRVTALRIAIKQQAGQKPAPQQDADTVFEALPAPGVDAELDLIKRRYHTEFRQAMLEAFSSLSPQERNYLRLYFVDQLSTYEMAALFRVNQGTVSRWLKDARQHIYEETRRHLQAKLGLSTQDFTSFLAVLDSQLELSLSQLLGEEDRAPRPPPPS